MDIYEAIKNRQSIRAFKNKAVPKTLLKKIMETSLLSPSWANSQPWEFAVVGGKTLQELADELFELGQTEVPGNPDRPMPEQWPDLNMNRIRALGKKMFEAMAIPREDKERRKQHYSRNYRFFGAPNIIYIYLDKELGAYSMLDVGIISQSIALLATAEGLGTCFLASSSRYPDVVREKLGIPKSKDIILGVAIGYPDMDDASNQFRSDRVEMDEVVKWVDV
jgi:nitroreductase